MTKRTLVALILVAAAAVVAAPAAVAQAIPGQRGTVWVTNRTLNNVSLYDAATGTLVATIPVGRDPGDVVVPPGSGKAYVTNELDNTVSVISTATRAVINTIPVGSRPHHIEVSRDGVAVYFGEFGTNKVGVIDTRSDTLTEYVSSANPLARTHQAFPTRDGRLVFAANEAANEVSAIDRATGQIAFAIAVGNRPSEVLVTPDGRTAYVSVRNENKVKRIDVATRTITGEVEVGTQPDTLQLTPDGRFVVVGLRGTPAAIAVVDTGSLSLAATVAVAGTGTLAGHNWLSADGRYSFVAFEGGTAPGVAVVDHASQTVVATYAYPGGGRPHGIFYADPAATAGPSIAIASRLVRVTGSRVAAVKVTCGADTIGSCRGTLTLGRFGSRGFAIEAGVTRAVRVRVSRQAFNRLLRLGEMRVRARAVARDLLDNARVATGVITLKAPRVPKPLGPSPLTG